MKRAVLFLVMLALSAAGCGGGSVGTGTGPGTKSFEGTIVTTENVPLVGALVRIIATGEEDLTDERGRFSLSSTVSGVDVEFQVIAPEVNTTFSVTNVSAETTNVQIDVVIDEDTKQVDVSNLEVKAEIVDSCAKSFQNGLEIVQTRGIPDDTRCIMRVEIKGDGVPLGSLPFIMQRRACSDKAKWHTIGDSETATGENVGVGRLGFYFLNNPAHCMYRVVAPDDVDGLKSVVYRVITLQKQRYDGEIREDEAIVPPEPVAVELVE